MSKESATQEHTEVAVFTPSNKMQEYLDTAVSLLTDSPSKVADNCEVARRTWYDWLKVEGFEDWFYAEYAKRRRRIIPKLDEIGMQYAKRGSYQHWEALNKKVGDLVGEGVNVNTQINITPILGEDKAE